MYFLHKKSQKNKDNVCSSIYNNNVICNGGGKLPEDENDEEEHPHGIYEDAGYHHMNSGNHKSAAPKNGQICLDNSFDVGCNSTRRISIKGIRLLSYCNHYQKGIMDML